MVGTARNDFDSDKGCFGKNLAGQARKGGLLTVVEETLVWEVCTDKPQQQPI